MIKKYEWIESEKKYFGKEDGEYNFEKNNINDIEEKN